MKIFVKTLKGDRFEIQVNPEDSVADVKKNIETVLRVTAAEQVLIYKGRVLKDETTLEANNVSEKGVIGVMKRKPASTGTSANLTAQVTPTEPAWDAASNGNYESVSESNIQQILEIVRGVWSREVVAYALCLAYNDLNKALEYLYFGIPVQSEDPYITESTQEYDTQDSVAPEVADLDRSLDSLRNSPEYEYLRAMVQSDPSLLKDVLENIEEENPSVFQLIQDHRADFFIRLLLEKPRELQDDDVLHFQSNELNNGGDSGNQVGESGETEVEQPQAEQTNEPNNGGGDGGNQVGESEKTEVDKQPQELQADQTNKPNKGGDGGDLVGESKETEVEVATPEDYELIERLEALGFERGDAAVAYFACNKNVQVAANHLLGYKHESRRQ